MRKITVGILGATGMVGQQYLQLLSNHPWFDVCFLASSELSAGKSYGEAVLERWHMNTPIPQRFLNMPVHRMDDMEQAKKSCSFVFWSSLKSFVCIGLRPFGISFIIETSNSP